MGLSMLQCLFLLVQWVCLCYSVSSSWYNGFVYVTVSLPLGTMGLSMLQCLFLLVQWVFLCYSVSSSWYNGFVYVTVSLPLGTIGLSVLQCLFLLVQWVCLCYSVSSSWYNGLSVLKCLFLLVQWVVCDALTFLLDNFFIRLGTKLYRQVVGIPIGTNCSLLVADLFMFCYERDFMKSLSDDKQADIIDAFNTISRYLDDILNINNVLLTLC